MSSTVEVFFERYRKAFESYDLDALGKLVHLPCLIASAGKLIACGDAGDLRHRLQRQFERHREAGVADAKFEVVDRRRLDPRFVVVGVRWTLLKDDGSELMDFGVSYTLTAPEAGWKIACVLPLDLG